MMTIKGATIARRLLASAALLGIASAALAQTVQDESVPDNTGLNIPANLQVFGKVDPNVRKATAIVNDTVITGTDVDQRVALVAAPPDQAVTRQCSETGRVTTVTHDSNWRLSESGHVTLRVMSINILLLIPSSGCGNARQAGMSTAG